MLISDLKVNSFYSTHGYIMIKTHNNSDFDRIYIFGNKTDMARGPRGDYALKAYWKPTPGAMFLYLGSKKTTHSFYMLGFGRINLYGNDVQFLKRE